MSTDLDDRASFEDRLLDIIMKPMTAHNRMRMEVLKREHPHEFKAAMKKGVELPPIRGKDGFTITGVRVRLTETGDELTLL